MLLLAAPPLWGTTNGELEGDDCTGNGNGGSASGSTGGAPCGGVEVGCHDPLRIDRIEFVEATRTFLAGDPVLVNVFLAGTCCDEQTTYHGPMQFLNVAIDNQIGVHADEQVMVALTGDCQLELTGTLTETYEVVAQVEIQFNDTAAENDDVVRVRDTLPAIRWFEPCRVRLVEAADEDVVVWLREQSGRIRLHAAESGNGEAYLELTLPKDGSWVSFHASGQNHSTSPDDTTIQAHYATPAGPVWGQEDATVCYNGLSLMLMNPADHYAYQPAIGEYGPVGNPGVGIFITTASFWGPEGLDHTAPPISETRVRYLQNVLGGSVYRMVYAQPTVQFLDEDADGNPITSGTTCTVPKRMAVTGTISETTLDAPPDARPFYTADAVPWSDPAGVGPVELLRTNDSPSISGIAPIAAVPAYDDDDPTRIIGTITYTEFYEAAIESTFRGYTVLAQSPPSLDTNVPTLTNFFNLNVSSKGEPITEMVATADPMNPTTPNQMPVMDGVLAGEAGGWSEPQGYGDTTIEFVKGD